MAEVTDAALAAAAPQLGEAVLAIGCGTGTTTLRLAEAVRPTGHVLGIDISEQQLGLARKRAAMPATYRLCAMMPRRTACAPQTVDLGFSRFGWPSQCQRRAEDRSLRGLASVGLGQCAP
jgi:SAM-dependent methyltransferase